MQGKCVLTGDNVGCPLHLKFADLLPSRNVHSSACRSVTQFCTENVQCTKGESV